MLKGGPREQPPLVFDPVPGVEARDAGYVDWLLAGGAPIVAEADRGWADTVKDELS